MIRCGLASFAAGGRGLGGLHSRLLQIVVHDCAARQREIKLRVFGGQDLVDAGRGWMDAVPAQILRRIRPRNGPRGIAGVDEAVGGGIRVHRCHQTVHIEDLHAGLAREAVSQGAVHRLRESGPKRRRRRPVGGDRGREAHVGDTPHGDVHRAFALQGVNDVRHKLQRGRGVVAVGLAPPAIAVRASRALLPPPATT